MIILYVDLEAKIISGNKQLTSIFKTRKGKFCVLAKIQRTMWRKLICFNVTKQHTAVAGEEMLRKNRTHPLQSEQFFSYSKGNFWKTNQNCMKYDASERQSKGTIWASDC